MVKLDYPEATSTADLWRNVRKGHQADIRHAEKIVELHSDLNENRHRLFTEYQELHRLDAGRLTRPQTTFDLMESWLPENGLVVVGTINSTDITEIVGAAYFIKYEGGAYYASAARNHAPRGTAHLLVWYAMLQLRFTCKWLDLGPVPDEDASDKEKSIAHFKRGFGAERRVWPYENHNDRADSV